MRTNEQLTRNRRNDRGVSILIVAVSMIFVLGIAGLGIDLASLYVGRSEAQRAADAAALAGAQVLAGAQDPTGNSPCVNSNVGGSISGYCMQLATQQAEAVGNANLIAGVSPNIGKLTTDVTFLETSTNDPQIQVIAARDTAHENPMPTFFVKIFGINTANISAKAVAEAYQSDGSGTGVGAQCVKPWLIPNCDPGNASGTASFTGANPNCPSGVGGFLVPTSNGSASSTLARDAVQAPNGPIGESFTMKPGTPGDTVTPGQYYAAYIPNTTVSPTLCPSCAGATPTSGGTGSAAVYRENIECCNPSPITCGPNNVTLQSTAGNMVGPTKQGVQCLIHQSGSTWPSPCGQDTLGQTSNPCGGPPPSIMTDLSITAGLNNPYKTPGSSLQPNQSDSVIAVPVWDGTPLQSGQNPNLNIVGFLQIFVWSVGNQQGDVYGTVMNVTACGAASPNGNGGTGPIVATGGSSIPVRLIHE